MKIPFVGLERQYRSIREEVLDTIDKVLLTGKVLDGPYVKQFEQKIAAYCNRTYAIAVNSGTQALILSMIATDLNNKEIIIPTVSFAATLNSVLMANSIPVFCDVDDYGQMDISRLTIKRTKDSDPDGIVFVNLFGDMVDINKIRLFTEFFNDNKMVVIEDAAQSLGAKYQGRPSGSFGDVSILSFDPMKNLPNYGSGGMVLTDSPYIAEYLLDLRNNGKQTEFNREGTNSKLSELDAAVMLVKFKYFEEWQRRRAEIATYYNKRFEPYFKITKTRDSVEHAWHKYPIWCVDPNNSRSISKTYYRSTIISKLVSLGIETRIHYDTPLNDLPSSMSVSDFAPWNAIDHCKTELSLPIYPELRDHEIDYIVDSVISCINR